MFPVRYFAPRYFAPRYFASATPPVPPPPRLGLIKILINGVERTDSMFYGSPASFNLMRGTRGSCQISFVVEPGELFAPQVGESIAIFDPLTVQVWRGRVQGVGIKWLGDDGWHVITVTGITLESLFDSGDVDKIKITGVTAGAAVATLYAASGVTDVTLGTVDAGPVIESLEVTNIWDGFTRLALIAGFVVYIDPADEALYFHAPGARAGAFTIASDDVIWESLDWKQSEADYRDKQVVQLPGVALVPILATFPGDDLATSFTLPTIPEYIITIDLSIGTTGRTVGWIPGTDIVTVTPAPPTGATVRVRYADTGVVAVTGTSPGIGSKTARYTRTRTFTPAGGLQEATAMLTKYAMLPATLQLSTDRPGMEIARKQTIALTDPAQASGLLNGDWLVQELNGQIVPGLDQKDSPYGHFRYTAHLINTAATAIFQGDGSTTTFLLPVIPTAVVSIRPSNALKIGAWFGGTNQITVTPALDVGEDVAVDYVDGTNAPDVPTFVNTWDQLAGTSGEPPTVLGQDPPATSTGGAEQAFTRTLTITDTAVDDDIAPHTPVYHDGTALRLLGVLRKAITADLTVRINKANVELITATIPLATTVDTVLEWSLAQGSPAVLGPFFDKEVLTADILESDGSTDRNGVAQFTVEWVQS